jgi:hypothetical protein
LGTSRGTSRGWTPRVRPHLLRRPPHTMCYDIFRATMQCAQSEERAGCRVTSTSEDSPPSRAC